MRRNSTASAVGGSQDGVRLFVAARVDSRSEALGRKFRSSHASASNGATELTNDHSAVDTGSVHCRDYSNWVTLDRSDVILSVMGLR